MTEPLHAPVPAGPVAIRVPAWRVRLDDPAEPLFTMAVVCELLATDSQTLRRLEPGLVDSNRTDGNHRRYSHDDVVRLGDALELLRAGVPRAAIARVLELQARVDVLEALPTAGAPTAPAAPVPPRPRH